MSDIDPKLHAKMLDVYRKCSEGAGGKPGLMWGAVQDMRKHGAPGSVWDEIGEEYDDCWFQMAPRHLQIFRGDDMVLSCDLKEQP